MSKPAITVPEATNRAPRTERYVAAAAMIAAHLAMLLVLIYSAWLATHFAFRFPQMRYMDSYRLQANGFAHGHVYGTESHGWPLVGCTDCMSYKARAYMAYGPVPAIFQFVLVNWLKTNVTSAAIVWWLCAATLYASFWIVRWYARRILHMTAVAATLGAGAFVVCVGTSDLFLHTAAVPFGWSQASACGQLCLLLSMFFFLRDMVSRRWTGLFWAGLFGALAFLSKQNYAPGCAAGLLILGFTARRERWTRSLLIHRFTRFLAPIAVGVLCLLWFNWARFQNPFDSGVPYFNATETAPVYNQLPEFRRIPANFYNHFLAGVRIQTDDFPFVRGNSINPKNVLIANYPMFSLFISVPMLLLLFPGILAAAKKRFAAPWDYWVYLLTLSVCVFALFLEFNASWMRYQYDMFFPIALCTFQVAVLGWRHAAAFRPGWVVALRTCLGLFLGLSFLEQAALGLDQTASLFLSRSMSFIHWVAYEMPRDERRRERAQHIRAEIFRNEAAVPFSLRSVVSTDTPQPAPNIGDGFFWFIRSRQGLYRKTPYGWRRVFSGMPQAQYWVMFTDQASGRAEPLLQWGTPPSADALAVNYNGDLYGQMTYQHWGGSSCAGSMFPYDRGRRYQLGVLRDALMQHVEVYLDDLKVLECDAGVYDTDIAQMAAGTNAGQFPDLLPKFLGKVEVVPPAATTSADSKQTNISFETTLPKGAPGSTEPLLQFGSNLSQGYMLAVTYMTDSRVSLLLETPWMTPLCSSEPLIVSHTSPAKFAFTASNGRTIVSVNGKSAIDCAADIPAGALTTRVYAKNTLGFTSVSKAYPGTILPQ